MNDAARLLGLAAFVLSVSALIHVSVAAWVRWRASDRQDRGKSETDADALLASIGEQLVRIEQALETHGTELERLGEAQRFTAKLLAERAEPAPNAAPSARLAGRIVTPH